MNADQLLLLVGHYADDPAIKEVFKVLRTRRRPELDPNDRDVMRDWVLIRRNGVELGFIDEVFFQAGPKKMRRRKGSRLLLCQIYFYNQRDDITRFKGALPLGLDWSDDSKQARSKLSRYESTRRSYLKDTWDLPAYRMTVEYDTEGSTIQSIICQLRPKDWPEEGRLQPSLSVNDWLALLYVPATSIELHDRLRPLDLQTQVEQGGNDQDVDFLFECGLELYFTELQQLKPKKNPVLIRKETNVLAAVQFFQRRELDARKYLGPLPFDLSFDDTQTVMFEKVGRPADEHEDDFFSGAARWYFEEFSLEVLYNNIENHLLRVTIMAPGF